MSRHDCLIAGTVGACLLIAVAWTGSAADGPQKPAPNDPGARERMRLAQSVYEQSLERLKLEPDHAPRDVEYYYGWSTRWLEAALAASSRPDDRLAALKDHQSRMQYWKDRSAADRARGIVAQYDVDAAAYFLLEASQRVQSVAIAK